jgi:hypothetical protein
VISPPGTERDWQHAVVVAAAALALACLSQVTGCTVRSVTSCISYSRALQRPDPETYVQKDSGDASVCVETGPRE